MSLEMGTQLQVNWLPSPFPYIRKIEISFWGTLQNSQIPIKFLSNLWGLRWSVRCWRNLYNRRRGMRCPYCQILLPWQNSGYKRQCLIWRFNQIPSFKDSSCCSVSLDKIIGPISSYPSGHNVITSWGQEEMSPVAILHSYIHYKRFNNYP